MTAYGAANLAGETDVGVEERNADLAVYGAAAHKTHTAVKERDTDLTAYGAANIAGEINVGA